MNADARHSPRRRALLQAGSLVLLLGAQQIARGASVVAVRIWPSKDYTRVTIESDGALKARKTSVNDPPQLQVEIEGIDLVEGMRELVGKLKSDDPNIAGIKVTPVGPNLVRLSIDLTQAIKPQVFNLAPVAAYQHRLVFDLYPAEVPDPLAELIAQRSAELDAASARAARLLGHETEQLGPLPVAQDPLADFLARNDKAAARPVAPTAGSKVPPPGEAVVAGSGKRPARTERLIIVALDPGHGGEDPGAIGPAGTREKDVVLKVALRLRDRINASRANGNPMRAFLTRDADFFVPLGMRVQKARQVQADLFVSLHADAFLTPQPQGASVFALSSKGASSATARWLANKENAADLVGGINVKAKDATVQRALLDMSTTAQIKDSLKLAGAVLGEVGRVGKLHKGQVEQASFAVLKAPDIPSVLVETAFISNPDEEQRLISEAYQVNLAEALLKGIVKYFSANPPLARSREV